MHNFRELRVWKEAVELATLVYRSTEAFPKEEKFGLTNQIRRSAISISSNIAEGCGRNSNKELYHFLGIANGSACELETQLIVSFNLGFVSKKVLDTLIDKLTIVKKMNTNFQKSIYK